MGTAPGDGSQGDGRGANAVRALSGRQLLGLHQKSVRITWAGSPHRACERSTWPVCAAAVWDDRVGGARAFPRRPAESVPTCPWRTWGGQGRVSVCLWGVPLREQCLGAGHGQPRVGTHLGARIHGATFGV